MWKLSAVLVIGLLAGFAAQADAAWVDGLYWADSVHDWVGPIQNYGGTPMDATTTWWLEGPPDADVDGNGYAWDAVDQDTVAGWRMPSTGNDELTVRFDIAFDDGPGNDVMVYGYRGSGAAASVWAGSDGTDFTQIGTIGGGQTGYFEEFWFDLGGLSDVRYILVDREAVGSGTGAFFDAVALVPEPATGLMLLGGGLFVLIRRS